MDLKNKFDKVIKDIQNEIERATNIVVTGHVEPDGDALASSLSMKKAISERYPDKNVLVALEDISEIYTFMEGSEDIVDVDGVIENMPDVDLCISVDFSDIKRAGKRMHIINEMAKINIVIDHHQVIGESFGDFNYIDSDMPAAAQMVYVFLEKNGYDINKDLLEIIICGIITDTGGFRYPSTNLQTFEIAKLAKSMGIDFAPLYDNLMFTKSENQLKLEALASLRLKIDRENMLAYTYLNYGDKEYVNSKIGETSAIVNIGRNINGIIVSLYLEETKEGYKISLRSKEKVDVSAICRKFGGGGHKRAAGATIENHDLDVVLDMILNELKSEISKIK